MKRVNIKSTNGLIPYLLIPEAKDVVIADEVFNYIRCCGWINCELIEEISDEPAKEEAKEEAATAEESEMITIEVVKKMNKQALLKLVSDNSLQVEHANKLTLEDLRASIVGLMSE